MGYLIERQEQRHATEWKSPWFTECVQGQTVLISKRNSTQVIAVTQLNDDGTPVKCEVL